MKMAMDERGRPELSPSNCFLDAGQERSTILVGRGIHRIQTDMAASGTPTGGGTQRSNQRAATVVVDRFHVQPRRAVRACHDDAPHMSETGSHPASVERESDPGQHHPLEPTLQLGRQTRPPRRIGEDDQLCVTNGFDMVCDIVCDLARARHIRLPLRRRHDAPKILGRQIEHRHVVSGGSKPAQGGVSHRRGETSLDGVAVDENGTHESQPSGRAITVTGVPDLTGDFSTGQLPKIAPGAVTVAIARTVDPGSRDQFESWCNEMMAAVKDAPGCLGATTLSPGRDDEAYHMVFRFVDVIHLRRWERSDVRLALLDRADAWVTSERVTVTAGDEKFFEALGSVDRHRTRFGKYVSDLLWIYPLALVVSIALAPAFAQLDVLWRVLITTAIMGLASTAAIGPVRRWWRRRRMLPQDSAIR